ncbi:hypothetical protein J4Q44_G00238760 [Coregonus suidteri]|uniref:Gypsy retrotransposon integrase-like protein 1 n=1 Tax=Coregonus suidteri TaxID=861788 RepID=A0AAN8LK35_9TELE
MYLLGKDGQPHRRLIFTKEEKEAVLTEMHAGHFGVKRMIAKINLRFFWRGIVKDVDSWVSTCLACQKFERVKTVAAELKPIKVVSPWHMIGVDLIGPFTKSRNGNH